MKLSKDQSAIQWYVRRGKKVRGPFPSGTIRRLVTAGRVLTTDEVSLDQVIWRQLGLVAEVLPPGMRNHPAGEEEDDYSGLAPDLPLPFEEKAPFPIVPLLVSIGLVVGVVGLFVYLDQNQPGQLPDCNAAPAPGLNWNNCKLLQIAAQQKDLHGLQAANADLAGAKLSGANLSGAQLQYANLVGADLAFADLSGASLKGAILRNADLSNAQLDGADLSYADLTNANLSKARLDGATWAGGKRCAKGSVGECRVE